MLRQCAHRPKAIQAPFDVGFGLVPMSDSSSPGCRGPRRRRARVTEALLRYGVSRRRRTRTTRGDSGRRAAPDRIGRQFDADLPDRLWIPTCPRVAPGQAPMERFRDWISLSPYPCSEIPQSAAAPRSGFPLCRVARRMQQLPPVRVSPPSITRNRHTVTRYRCGVLRRTMLVCFEHSAIHDVNRLARLESRTHSALRQPDADLPARHVIRVDPDPFGGRRSRDGLHAIDPSHTKTVAA